MAMGMIFIPIGDGIAKHIQNSTEPPTPKHSRFWLKQCIRGLLIAATVHLIVTAVGLSPIADVFGAFFIGPGVSVILAQWFLNARANLLDWVAVLLGFIGVLMVVQPTGAIGPGIPWALAAGCCYGSFLVATRWAAGSGPPLAQLAAQFSVAAVCLTPLGLPELLTYGLLMPGWVLASALLSGTANLFSIIALSRADNAVLAPIVYVQVVSATVVGFVVFNEIPNQLTAVGLTLIIATGVLQALKRRHT